MIFFFVKSSSRKRHAKEGETTDGQRNYEKLVIFFIFPLELYQLIKEIFLHVEIMLFL